MTRDQQEYLDGYLDGRDPTSPTPSDNRSWCYRHSWHIGRTEIEGRTPMPAHQARKAAAVAAIKDSAS